MKVKSLILGVSVALASSLSVNGASITFGAAIANNLAGVGGVDLNSTTTIEVGTWDGSSFASLGTSSNDNVAFGPGFFQNVGDKFNSNSLVGQQLAIQWTESSVTGLIYYDITSGSDSARVAQWTVKAGDGGALDNNINAIDIADLTIGISGNVLDPAAVLSNVDFGGSNLAGVPSFSLVPEPSSYALLAGFLGLGCVALRRRK